MSWGAPGPEPILSGVNADAATAELRLLDGEVDRFCRRALDPRVRQHEKPMTPDDVAELLGEATELGLVAGRAPGVALWDDLDEGPRRTTRMLVRLARSNAGFAWAAHLASLAQVVARRIDAPSAGLGAIVISGTLGVGRDALARYLARAELDEADAALLADVWASAGPRLATVPHRVGWLLVPFFADGAMHWERVGSESAHVDARDAPHGLDELATAWVRKNALASVNTATGEGARAAFEAALGAAAVGAIAVALGATRHALDIARDYAHVRRQGGELIERHAAVQRLLGRARASVENVAATLETLARSPFDEGSLFRILAARSEAHPALCRAANDAMQVLGGIGYMRDAGVEKIVRDVNHLRLACGSPAELRLVVGEWGRHVA